MVLMFVAVTVVTHTKSNQQQYQPATLHYTTVLVYLNKAHTNGQDEVRDEINNTDRVILIFNGEYILENPALIDLSPTLYSWKETP